MVELLEFLRIRIEKTEKEIEILKKQKNQL